MRAHMLSIAVVVLLLLDMYTGLGITTADLKTKGDFSSVIAKISQEKDAQGRPFLDWASSVSFYQSLVTEFPYVVRELRNIGKTELEENIYGLYMSYKYTSAVDSLGITNALEFMSDASKPVVLIIGGHQGNSMIAHTFVMTLVAKLIHGFHNNDTKIVNLLKLRNVWFVPFLNIDTYKFIQSYVGDITTVQVVTKSRKAEGGCSELDRGISLINNYSYKWGIDNFGSTGTECLNMYRGTSEFSAAETKVVRDFFDSLISPTLVLSLESSGHYIKHPFNYVNDATNAAIKSGDYHWFYTSLTRDINNSNLGTKIGNNLSLFSKTNNGDNDDYFRGMKNTMSFTWSVGHKNYTSLSLSDTTSDKISAILSSNLDTGLYAIEKGGEQISVTVDHFDVCIPITEQCDGYEPEDGVWQYYVRLKIFNSGVRDLITTSEVKISPSNSKMSILQNSHHTTTNSLKRELSTSSVSIIKSNFYGREGDTINFDALIRHDTDGDSLAGTNSLGNLTVTLTYFGTTITVKDVAFKSYKEYKSTLDKYYYSKMKRGTFILFVIF